MLRSDFNYELPKELIAQTPAEPRDSSRMMVLDKKSGETVDAHFSDIVNYLHAGDLLVLNDTKVIPARIFGVKDSGAACEILLLRQRSDCEWEALLRPGKRFKAGTRINFENQTLQATVLSELDDGQKLIGFNIGGAEFLNVLDEIGRAPLPPYITEQLNDPTRYQTVYANYSGSAAAPTAGFHFTKSLLEKLGEQGVNIAYVTLHIGLGTFRPVKAERIEDHLMHSEWYSVPAETADAVKRTKANGGRVVCVGTTSCRTLESVCKDRGEVTACSGNTSIFIYPGYKFGVMDALITNFHLPESTLIMLVSAFAGYDNTMNAYKRAVEKRYRFFSFGDAMLIV